MKNSYFFKNMDNRKRKRDADGLIIKNRFIRTTCFRCAETERLKEKDWRGIFMVYAGNTVHIDCQWDWLMDQDFGDDDSSSESDD